MFLYRKISQSKIPGRASFIFNVKLEAPIKNASNALQNEHGTSREQGEKKMHFWETKPALVFQEPHESWGMLQHLKHYYFFTILEDV